MKTLLMALGCVAAISVMLITAGCDHAQAAPSPSGSLNGKKCTVQFRRDALGAAANLPVSPLTNGINGAETSIAGTLRYTNEDWVVIDRDGKEVWIPKGVILLIRFE